MQNVTVAGLVPGISGPHVGISVLDFATVAIQHVQFLDFGGGEAKDQNWSSELQAAHVGSLRVSDFLVEGSHKYGGHVALLHNLTKSDVVLEHVVIRDVSNQIVPDTVLQVH